MTDNVVKFEKELTHLINKYSMENCCNMPDFLLANKITHLIINNQISDKIEEIEIIEEDKPISKLYINNELQYDLNNNKIEKIDIDSGEHLTYETSCELQPSEVIDAICRIEEKINELIDIVNESRSKDE